MPYIRRSSGFVAACFFSAALAMAFPPGGQITDPGFPQQWALENTGQTVGGQPGFPGADIHIVPAWAIHCGTRAVTVAIVGSGVDPHPEFSDRLLEGRAFVGDLFDTRDGCGPGTQAAGVIAAATGNGQGIAGVHDQVRLLPVRVLSGCAGSEATAATGIIWAVDQGAEIVVVLLQFHSGTQELADAIRYAVDHQVLVVATAGKAADARVAFPAAFDGCVAVSASTNQDALAGFSNYGAEVELAAPGEGILTTVAGGGFVTVDQAWACAPALVAGAAALVRSYAPQLTAVEIRQILRDAADDLGAVGRDPFFGFGRLNVGRALQLAKAPPIRFEPVDPPPTMIAPGIPTSFMIRIADVAGGVVASSATVWSRTAGTAFIPSPLTSLGQGLFSVGLLGGSCDTNLEYYLSADSTDGIVVFEPFAAPTASYSARVVNESLVFADDFESDRGWQSGVVGGAATRGAWERVVPVGTFLGFAPIQPDFDHSPDAGMFCYLTEQHRGGPVGTSDVDGGPVQLLSPVVMLSTPDAEIRYARWFVSQGGTSDVLTVELSRDGGGTWVTVETVASSPGWVWHSFRLSDFPQVAGEKVQVRFSTSDDPNDSLTEAGIDDFSVRAIQCAAGFGDVNADGRVDLADFREMVSCWTGPAGGIVTPFCAPLDFDHDADIDLDDHRAFQNFFNP